MRIAFTGATGQFGQAFAELASRTHDVVPLGRANGFDLAQPETVAASIAQARPTWVVHAAAMTDVDGCERDPARAHAVNALGTQAVAKAAVAVGAKLVCISTDYVYDGAAGNYVEGAPTNPLSVYGRSKLEGERLAQAVDPDCVIARTSVVFGPHKKNFVAWVRGELAAGRSIRVVDDQFVNPTLTYDLVGQILALIEQDASGLYHTAGKTSLSRLDMAYVIADHFGYDRTLIQRISSKDLAWLAARPPNATLNTGKVSRIKAPMTFSEALQLYQEKSP